MRPWDFETCPVLGAPFQSNSDLKIKQAMQEITQQITVWFDEQTVKSMPSSKAATIQMNTIDLPKRIAHLLNPISEIFKPTQAFDLLDVGCGYGGIPLFLSLMHPNAHITAIDTSDRFFSVSQKTTRVFGLDNLTFRVENILEVADSQKYDVIIVSNVINYLTHPKDLEKACHNIMQALKPGGWAVIHTPHFWSYREPFTKVPFLHILPINLRGKVSRWLKKRPSFHDVRLPSFFELRKFLGKYDGKIVQSTHKSLFEQFMSTHLTIWVRKKEDEI